MIQVYWKNATAEVVGDDHGIMPDDLATLHDRLIAAHKAVTEQIAAGNLGYATLPTDEEYPGRSRSLLRKYKAITTDLVGPGHWWRPWATSPVKAR